MIYDPIPFVKLVQKISVGNDEPIMGICGKIFIINLLNLQMLLCCESNINIQKVWSPCTNMKAPQWKTLLATVLRRTADTGQLRPNLFCSTNFVVLRKICFNHMTKKTTFPPKNLFCSLSFKTWLRAKIVSAIRILCFEGHSASRCSITPNTFL